MSGIQYTGSIGRPIEDILGDHVSVLSFGALGDGATDDSAAFNAAIQSLLSLNGRDLYVPGGRTYVIKSPLVFPSGLNYIGISGDGDSTVIKRGASMPAGKGMFDVQGATNVIFRNFKVDGSVTTPAQLIYSDFASDPMNASLTTNTSFWLHGGSNKIRLEGITITHTGGYAVLLDTTTGGDISDVRIIDCLFENNRPHLFGTSSGDKNYGSWTGGVHFQGDGNSQLFTVKNLIAQDCTWRRNTGNCFWGHVYNLNIMHSNVRVVACHFEDCGLDGVEMGAVTGGVVDSCTFRRVGYITTDDTTASVPKWNSAGGIYAVAVDTAGRTRGINYTNNTFVSVNGGCMDLDGFSQGSVVGNTCIYPRVGEYEYAQDSIASAGPGGNGQNWTYGVQTGNTNNDSIAGTDVHVSGNTFINIGGGAIKLYCARGCTASANKIDHDPGAQSPPIMIGNTGTGANQRAYNNVIHDNAISYSPSSPVACVYEDAQFAAFQSSDKNWVFGNRILGTNSYEFNKDTNTSSVTKVVMTSSASKLTVGQESWMQREGDTNTHGGYLRFYRNVNGVVTSLGTLLDEVSLGGGAFGGPLFNVTSGAGTGGVLSTGPRTTSAIDDAVVTGHLYGDAFLALTDTTLTYPNDTKADVMPATVGLLRFNSTSKVFEQSTSIVSGHRVWSPLGGGATIAGTDKQIQYNKAGVLGADANFVWDYTNRVFTITTGAGVAGLVMVNGFIQSNGGFFTGATNTDSIQSPSGGVTAKYLISTESIFTIGVGVAPALPSTGQGKLYYDSGSNKFKVSEGGSAWQNLFGGGVVGLDQQVQYNKAGAMAADANFKWDYTNKALVLTGSAGVVGLELLGGYAQADGGFVTGSTAFNAIQAPSGGMLARTLDLSTPNPSGTTFPVLRMSVPGLAATCRFMGPLVLGEAAAYMSANLFFNASTGQFLQDDSSACSTVIITRAPSNVAANPVLQIFTSKPGSPNAFHTILVANVQGNVGIGGSANTAAGAALTVAGSAGVAAIYASNGFIQSDGGFATGSTAFNAIQAASGGVSVGLGITLNQALYSRSNAAAPNTPSGGYSGLSHKSGSQWWYYNTALGWQTVDFAAVGNSNNGVTSIVAGTNIAISGSTGAVTIGTITTPTFSGVILNGDSIYLNNNIGIRLKQTTGSYQNVLTMGSDNNLYVDNLNLDVYVRPQSNRFVFIGQSGAFAYLCPTYTGNTLGTNTFPWNAVYIGSGGVFLAGAQVFDGQGRVVLLKTVLNGTTYQGETFTYTWPSGFTVNGVTFHNMVVINGIIVQHYA